jgi:hypothetical protein
VQFYFKIAVLVGGWMMLLCSDDVMILVYHFGPAYLGEPGDWQHEAVTRITSKLSVLKKSLKYNARAFTTGIT